MAERFLWGDRACGGEVFFTGRCHDVAEKFRVETACGGRVLSQYGCQNGEPCWRCHEVAERFFLFLQRMDYLCLSIILF